MNTNNFHKFQFVDFDPSFMTENHEKSLWIVRNDKNEIWQKNQNHPSAAIGYAKYDNVNFEGTLLTKDVDDDYIGFIFSYQSNQKFYVLSWKKTNQTIHNQVNSIMGLQLKLVNSTTGPSSELSNNLWQTHDRNKQTKLLWLDPNMTPYKMNIAYKWLLFHRPNIGLIRIRIFEGNKKIADSGNIFDYTLAGGRLGIYSFSQKETVWSNMDAKCQESLPKDIHKELPFHLRKNVPVENS